MKILLFALFSFTTIALSAQSVLQSTISKFKKEISLPFSTPSELPIVGEYADELLEFSKSKEEISELKKWAAAYPEITNELYESIGKGQGKLRGSAQYFPYGKFKVGETTFLMVLETGREARSRRPYQNLVLLAIDENLNYTDIRYLMHEEISFEYDEEEYEDAIEVTYHTFYSSQLKKLDNFLIIRTDELQEVEIVKENATETESYSNSTDFKYLPAIGQFEVQFD